MAEVNSMNSGSGKKRRGSVLGVIKLDMTPMVDLAFLLLTFFILATTLALPRTMEIVYPKEGKPTDIPSQLANTLLLGDSLNQVYYYPGKFKSDSTQLKKVSLTGQELSQLIQLRNQRIYTSVMTLEGQRKRHQLTESEFKAQRSALKSDPKAPFFIIKTLGKSKYKEIVEVLDELNAGQVSKYAVVDMSEAEKNLVAVQKRRGNFN
jgi:biopolymer transport protein ExbD